MKTKPKPAGTPEGTILLNAIIGCGNDIEAEDSTVANGAYEFMSKYPLTLLCEKIVEKMKEQGFTIKVGPVTKSKMERK